LNDVKGFNVREVWRHSIRVGMVSEQLARACRTRAADLMPQDDYTCGLLHDIGEIVLYDNFGEEYVNLLNSRAPGTRQVAAEAAGLLGLDHTGIGALAATNWHLPSPLPELIKDHHRPLDKPSLAEAATVIASADEIVILVHANPTEDPKKLTAESQVIPIGCKPLGIVAAITCVQTARGQVTL